MVLLPVLGMRPLLDSSGKRKEKNVCRPGKIKKISCDSMYGLMFIVTSAFPTATCQKCEKGL